MVGMLDSNTRYSAHSHTDRMPVSQPTGKTNTGTHTLNGLQYRSNNFRLHSISHTSKLILTYNIAEFVPRYETSVVAESPRFEEVLRGGESGMRL